MFCLFALGQLSWIILTKQTSNKPVTCNLTTQMPHWMWKTYPLYACRTQPTTFIILYAKRKENQVFPGIPGQGVNVYQICWLLCVQQKINIQYMLFVHPIHQQKIVDDHVRYIYASFPNLLVFMQSTITRFAISCNTESSIFVCAQFAKFKSTAFKSQLLIQDFHIAITVAYCTCTCLECRSSYLVTFT